MIREIIHQNISKIARKSGRSIRVTLERAESKMPIRIISTYAPRNGHTEEAKRKHWGDVQELLNKTCERHLIIWGAGANGQMRNRNHGTEEKYTKKDHVDQRIKGPYARANRAEKEMEQDYTEYAEDNRRCRWQHGKPQDSTNG